VKTLALVAGVVCLFVGCSNVKTPFPLPNYRQPELSNQRIPCPVLLLHGLGQRGDVWKGAASSYFTKTLGLTIGKEVFIVDFANPFDSINAWRDELDKTIAVIRKTTGAHSVILVGYSMGGVAARAYVTKRYTDHHVQRLITIGSPHLGSAFAKAYNWKTRYGVSVPGSNIPLDSPALRDLRRPEDGGSYLRSLSKFAHPNNIEYISVIGEVDMFESSHIFSSAGLQELLRKLLSSSSNSNEVFQPGDGVVSSYSQNMMNIEWFASNPQKKRVTRTIPVESVHVDHLQKSTEIQQLVFEDKPEFKGAFFAMQNMVPVLVIDFADYLPFLCSVGVSVEGRAIPVSQQIFNISTPEGIVSRLVVPLAVETDTGAMELSPKQRFVITITNSFGYTTTTSVQW
jgi:pimeloyl-ACP methyl ester carboxylesterase